MSEATSKLPPEPGGKERSMKARITFACGGSTTVDLPYEGVYNQLGCPACEDASLATWQVVKIELVEDEQGS